MLRTTSSAFNYRVREKWKSYAESLPANSSEIHPRRSESSDQLVANFASWNPGDDLFNTNATIVAQLTAACAKAASNAVNFFVAFLSLFCRFFYIKKNIFVEILAFFVAPLENRQKATKSDNLSIFFLSVTK